MEQWNPTESNDFSSDAPVYAAQQAEVIRKDAPTPEETPPNTYTAATGQAIPLKDPPWNEWLRLARQGDETAKLRFCTRAESFIELFCRVGYFRHFLGKEEIRSIANLAVAEFMMTYDDLPKDREIPFLLKRIIRNALINPAKRAEVRSRREHRPAEPKGKDENDTGITDMDIFPAKRNEEPEAKLLTKELYKATAEAFQQLLPNEQAAIRAFFFQNKTASAIARELQCTRQNVEQMRDRALRRLRQILEDRHICSCGA